MARGAPDSYRKTTPTAARVYTDEIEAADIAGAQILVLINSPKRWMAAERRVVLNFVSAGGSLLVLGDHTDVFGLMRGFNTLVGPEGVRFRFDSAYRGARGGAVAKWRRPTA